MTSLTLDSLDEPGFMRQGWWFEVHTREEIDQCNVAFEGYDKNRDLILVVLVT